MALTLLLVEDDAGLRTSLTEAFTRQGYEVVGVGRVEDGIRTLRERAVAVVLLDLHLPDGSGLEVLTAAREIDPETSVVVMTAYPEVRTAVRAMKDGASDFVIKPFDLAALRLAVERVVELRSLRRSVRRLDRERQRARDVRTLVGESAAVAGVREQIAKVAPTDTPVLIVGPTGVGKELVADAIHELSPRAQQPLVKVNCSAVSETLLESELFGHEKGAFTDARAARAGLFEMADGGTLLLDEISEMKLGLQAKLLRVVEGHPFRRVGGQREIRSSVRVLAATNRDLDAEIKRGAFREDLYFRLNVFRIEVPPLRQRGDDVTLLARFFLDRAAATLRKPPLRFTPEAERLLLAYGWPGNVRELRNVVERAVILSENPDVTPASLPLELQAAAFARRAAGAAGAAGAGAEPGRVPSLDLVTREYVAHVVRELEGNLSQAARALGISRNTLKAKLRSTEQPDDS